MNQNVMSLLALGISLFFAGSFIGGEFHRQRAIKAELRAIQEEQKRTMAEIAAANQNYVEKRQTLLQETAKIYSELDSILQLKSLNSKQLLDARKRVTDAREAVDLQSKALEDVLKTRIIELDNGQEE